MIFECQVCRFIDSMNRGVGVDPDDCSEETHTFFYDADGCMWDNMGERMLDHVQNHLREKGIPFPDNRDVRYYFRLWKRNQP